VWVEAFNPFGIPLLNTTILLTSGLTVTWRHHTLINRDHYQRVVALWLTIALGVYFTVIQAYEYLQASFSFADSVYGSCFFMATGFHGAHVLIGTVFLRVVLIRLGVGQLRPSHHFGFEAAA
jgi:heme/copper-type cytochrome/quinol oxidase subunit 3